MSDEPWKFFAYTGGQMTHTIEKYGDIGNFSGVTYVILPFMNLWGHWPLQPK